LKQNVLQAWFGGVAITFISNILFLCNELWGQNSCSGK
jgi:hypothetical protein